MLYILLGIFFGLLVIAIVAGLVKFMERGESADDGGGGRGAPSGGARAPGSRAAGSR